MSHRIRIACAVLPIWALFILLPPACCTSSAPTDPNGDPNGEPTSQALAWFEQVWSDFDQNYSHFGSKGVDWDAIRTQYRPDFLSELTIAEFLDRIAPLLAELMDLHVSLWDPNGDPVETYSRPGARNYLANYTFDYFPNGVSKLNGKYPLRHGWMEDNIAYIGIESFSSDAWDGLTFGELDDLFGMYADANGMIVDVRRNNGGSEDIAKAIAGHFTDTKVTYGYHKDRIPGDDHNAFGDAVAHELDPADNARFLKPVVVLIGEVNMSSAEWFILMMLQCEPVELTIGETTRGSSGNPQEFSLSNGISYLIPSWIAYQWDMTEIEDVGIDPNWPIAAGDSYDDDLGDDYVLDLALAWLTAF